jgi:carboxyvinyl-carboxyphosphonate phosphorylmutase
MNATEKRKRLRAVLAGSRCVSPATVFDALSARVAESVGYEFGILSGSVCAATVLGAPDLVLQTLTEFADQVRRITRVSDLSVFVDADQGYGNALNARRTVEELEHAGLAGLAIEDLIMPPRFGNTGPDELVSIDEMKGKLRAALQARQDPALVIVARTAGLKTEPVERVVARAREYAETGVDGVFLTGLEKLTDLDAVRAAVKLPIIIGSSPLKREDLAARGVRFCLQGHGVIPGVVKAMREIYSHLHSGGLPGELKPKLAPPEEMERLLGTEQYKKWQREYLA